MFYYVKTGRMSTENVSKEWVLSVLQLYLLTLYEGQMRFDETSKKTDTSFSFKGVRFSYCQKWGFGLLFRKTISLVG